MAAREWGSFLYTVQPRRNKHYPRLRHGKIISTRRPNRVFTRKIAAALGIVPRNDAEPVSSSRFTLHKLADMRRTGVGKPRPLLDQEKLDLFRVAKKFDRLVADLERKMRAALRRLKEMLTGHD
ncbi:hypothetical protein DPMN_080762 [Dreissena polymorpha]|uniref:Uncharacterized protein n=1 Tax=Dreissena polymorpha TaxID=45954 RepID=A0A9D3YV65_DREPO|nr:hypothetical protein DPMN_080762 [Dreissena polymorpha]